MSPLLPIQSDGCLGETIYRLHLSICTVDKSHLEFPFDSGGFFHRKCTCRVSFGWLIHALTLTEFFYCVKTRFL